MVQRKRGSPARSPRPLPSAAEVVAELRRRGSGKVRSGMARYGLPSDRAFGVSVGTMRQMARRIGSDHELAEGLWKTGWYEARMMAAFVDVPDQVTSSQMDRWARDWDSWGICDTACFALFARSPLAWNKVTQWAKRRDEFVKRGAFALLASLVAHDRLAGDDRFVGGLELIERAAGDDRNFVMKGVNWALRTVGKRNIVLNRAAIEVARRLSERDEPSARWIGRDALRELTGAAVARRLAKRGKIQPAAPLPRRHSFARAKASSRGHRGSRETAPETSE
ncbi:MAG: DNA alkylation repair protein [Gemmatimonadota bacterium]